MERNGLKLTHRGKIWWDFFFFFFKKNKNKNKNKNLKINQENHPTETPYVLLNSFRAVGGVKYYQLFGLDLSATNQKITLRISSNATESGASDFAVVLKSINVDQVCVFYLFFFFFFFY